MAWQYQELLNADLYLILAMAVGVLSMVCRLFTVKDVGTISKYVFSILLPSSVILGLGIKSDLLDSQIWKFVGAFLMLRVIWLIICIVFFGLVLKQHLGDVVASWMAVTWISTIILGVPILRAVLGPTYAPLGIVASISSFIFQLPLQLVLFEIHVWRQKTADQKKNQNDLVNDEENGGQALAATTLSIENTEVVVLEAAQNGNSTKPVQQQEESQQQQQQQQQTVDSSPPEHYYYQQGKLVGFGTYKLTTGQLKSIASRLIHNNILWAVLIGLILSLSTLGPTYLDPGTPPLCSNPDYAIGAGFIHLLFSAFAACTEPTALFATGLFMARKNPLPLGILKSAAYMVVKLVLVPAVMVGCAAAVGLSDPYARAAVLIAALPIAPASSVLSKQYGVGDKVVVSNVVLGNLLILPTTLVWMAFMDGVDLFNSTAKPPAACQYTSSTSGAGTKSAG